MDTKINPYVAGDKVKIKKDLKDAYLEIWHHKGEILRVKYSVDEAVYFDSDLGTHFTNVKLVRKAKKCLCCGQVLPLSSQDEN